MGSFQRKTTLSWLTLTSSSTAFIPAVRPAVVAAAVFSQAVWAQHQVRSGQVRGERECLTVLSPPLAPMM